MNNIIIKRDGKEAIFDKTKIEQAILKAMKNGSGIIKKSIASQIADDAYDALYSKDDDIPTTVDQVEDYVYFALLEYGEDLTAKAYEGYRSVQEFKRTINTTDKSILDLVSHKNKDVMEENSNKNALLASTQRDLIAGEVSKDISRRILIPTEFVQAHDEGVIHWHDMDYTISPIFNCFSSDTKFITDLGVKKFKDCNPGQVVKVLDKNGIWREATVNKYGKQKLQTVTITSGRTTRKIRCTANHRWILKDGSCTTNLTVGDRLCLLPEVEELTINPYAFCFGFVLGDGSDYHNSTNSKGIQIRLCGDKIKYLETFIRCGYSVSSYKFENSEDIRLSNTNIPSKKSFLENKAWKYLSQNDLYSLFKGYYAADGFKDRNGIATANEFLAEMIRDISAIAGYHITSERFEIRNTPYKENASLYTFRFMKNQPPNRNWIVKEIDRSYKHLCDVWCVEEPVTNTFTLEGGIVTGNCCLINLEDMLDNGTVINGKAVETPKSFTTACTVTTQIMAQVASNQFGFHNLPN